MSVWVEPVNYCECVGRTCELLGVWVEPVNYWEYVVCKRGEQARKSAVRHQVFLHDGSQRYWMAIYTTAELGKKVIMGGWVCGVATLGQMKIELTKRPNCGSNEKGE